MQSIKAILQSFNPSEDKYISREFQKYGYDLSEEMEDFKHRALYIKLAKTVPRPILEKARNFVKDAGNVRSKPRLFMWKMAQLRKEWKEKENNRAVSLKNQNNQLKRYHIVVSGRVAGVGFRAWVLLLARRFGVFGWVRNTSYKAVEIVVEGKMHVLDQLAVLCKKGPPTASVSSIEKTEEQYTGEFKTFEIIKI